jgi:predicted nucleic acid-binding protein
MKVLVDTNVLLRLFQSQHPHAPLAEAAIRSLTNNGVQLCIVPQNMYEFWAVATRPLTNNGLGMPRDIQGYRFLERSALPANRHLPGQQNRCLS